MRAAHDKFKHFQLINERKYFTSVDGFTISALIILELLTLATRYTHKLTKLG